MGLFGPAAGAGGTLARATTESAPEVLDWPTLLGKILRTGLDIGPTNPPGPDFSSAPTIHNIVNGLAGIIGQAYQHGLFSTTPDTDTASR